jgi:pyrroloquinoline-quinone synthase
MTAAPQDRVLSPEELEAALRAVGAERYHNLHPFHKLLHSGALNRGQVQAWALNRYYYQSRIPAKDAVLLSRLPTPDLRRLWRSRLEDHDGFPGAEGTPDAGKANGGIERWLRLATGVGLDRDYVQSTAGRMPAVDWT